LFAVGLHACTAVARSLCVSWAFLYDVKVDILDTAGHLEFPAMRRLSISTAHAFLLVYSIDDRGSFDEVRRLWEQIKEERTGYSQLPCVIAGNKVLYRPHLSPFSSIVAALKKNVFFKFQPNKFY